MKYVYLGIVLLLLAVPQMSSATMCDTSYENCRVPLVRLIDNEKVGIDVFMWFMEDARYVAALKRAHDRGVQVRVLANNRWGSYTSRSIMLRGLRDAGIPIRTKYTSGMLHTKALIFRGQMIVEHGGANLSPTAFVPIVPYANYTDEIVQFNTTPSVVQTYMTSFDTWWTNTTHFRNYANVRTPVRANAPFEKDPSVQISTPSTPYAYQRQMVETIDAESVGIDAIQYRITDPVIVAAIVRAHERGVAVRILTDPTSMTWRNHGYYETKMRRAGVPIKRRVHAGLTHEKMVLFHGQGILEFGSQHWTATESAIEHNLYDTDPADVAWAHQHFDRKWASDTEFK